LDEKSWDKSKAEDEFPESVMLSISKK